MAFVQSDTTRRFKPGTILFFFFSLDDAWLIPASTCLGSSDLDGLLTFKFDKTASGWDNDVYVGLVQKLVDALVVKDGKSILECVAYPQPSPVLTL
jgi:hypothetical protein